MTEPSLADPSNRRSGRRARVEEAVMVSPIPPGLIGGRYKPLTDAEMRTHLSVWAITNAPLMAGNDLRTMSNTARNLLTNGTFLTIDQDWGGTAGTIYGHYYVDIWTKPMSTGGRAIALVNEFLQPRLAGGDERDLGHCKDTVEHDEGDE